MHLGDYQRAVDDLAEINTHSKDGRVLGTTGYCLFLAGEQKDRSISWFTKAIKEGFVNQFITYDLGYLYLESSSFKNANLYFKKAIELDPALAPAYLGLSEIELRKSLRSKTSPNLTFIDSAINGLLKVEKCSSVLQNCIFKQTVFQRKRNFKQCNIK